MRPLSVRRYQPTNLKQRWGNYKPFHFYLADFDFFAVAEPRLDGLALDGFVLDGRTSVLTSPPVIRTACFEFFAFFMLICAVR